MADEKREYPRKDAQEATMMKIVLEEDAGEQKTLRVFAETKEAKMRGYQLGRFLPEIF